MVSAVVPSPVLLNNDISLSFSDAFREEYVADNWHAAKGLVDGQDRARHWAVDDDGESLCPGISCTRPAEYRFSGIKTMAPNDRVWILLPTLGVVGLLLLSAIGAATVNKEYRAAFLPVYVCITADDFSFARRIICAQF